MDDVIAVCLELLEKDWQRHRRLAMDVVHQNDAAFMRIQAPHGAIHDRFRGAAAPPIVRVDIRAPDDKVLALQESFDRIGAAEARHAEEGRERLSVAECGCNRIDAVVDLALNPTHRQALEGAWMATKDLQNAQLLEKLDQMAEIRTEVRGIGERVAGNTNLAKSITDAVERIGRSIEDHEQRLRALERNK